MNNCSNCCCDASHFCGAKCRNDSGSIYLLASRLILAWSWSEIMRKQRVWQTFVLNKTSKFHPHWTRISKNQSNREEWNQYRKYLTVIRKQGDSEDDWAEVKSERRGWDSVVFGHVVARMMVDWRIEHLLRFLYFLLMRWMSRAIWEYRTQGIHGCRTKEQPFVSNTAYSSHIRLCTFLHSSSRIVIPECFSSFFVLFLVSYSIISQRQPRKPCHSPQWSAAWTAVASPILHLAWLDLWTCPPVREES